MDDKKSKMKVIGAGIGCAGMLLIGVLIVVGWFVSMRNGFVDMEERINGNWAQVENVLKRRADLIPNLVETVKGSAKLDKEVFTQIAEARAKLAGAGSGYSQQKVAAAQGFESALARLMVIVERYPELKSQAGFRQLQDELAGTENRIAVERRRFNESVTSYNAAIRRMPGNLVASMAGFERKQLFEISEEDKAVPAVKF